jgi:hypothetical protein
MSRRRSRRPTRRGISWMRLSQRAPRSACGSTIRIACRVSGLPRLASPLYPVDECSSSAATAASRRTFRSSRHPSGLARPGLTHPAGRRLRNFPREAVRRQVRRLQPHHRQPRLRRVRRSVRRGERGSRPPMTRPGPPRGSPCMRHLVTAPVHYPDNVRVFVDELNS